MKKRKSIEIGSEFHWPGLPSGPFLPWPKPHLFLALGREAVLRLWRKGSRKKSGRVLYIPDYFCPEVRNFWKNNGIPIRQYEDDPRWPQPQWHTLTPASGDSVLAVNYFGVRDGSVWKDWHKSSPRVLLIEDHSHDPLSTWAKTSTADYCFASIRKIFPTPDGAIIWSPRRHSLFSEPESQNWSGSALKLAGMIWKKEYFNGHKPDLLLKDSFRKFQIEGEKILSASTCLSISPWSRDLIAKGFPENWRTQRESNARLLIKLLQGFKYFKHLFTAWPEGCCPFNVILEFKSSEYREAFRSGMIARGVFAPVHWALDSGRDAHHFDLSSRLLTIPVDHRYGSSDMYHIAKIVKETDEAI